LLGDRVRMQKNNVHMDWGVFIRSMAARGNLGGLARATLDAVRVMDALGKDLIIVETVGVGQGEVDVFKAVHTSVVVLVPGMGDEVQAMKAGILEIGDVFVVNKADHDGVDKTVKDIELMLNLGAGQKEWQPEIFKTVATEGSGIEEGENLKEYTERIIRKEIDPYTASDMLLERIGL